MRSWSKDSINDKFTNLADKISEIIGLWWVTALSMLFVLIWLAFGPVTGFSDSWQLWINTPTTILEMWLAFLIAAATNRSERRSRELQHQQKRLLEDATEKETQIQRQEQITRDLVAQINAMESGELLPTQKEQLKILNELYELQRVQTEILSRLDANLNTK